MYQRLILVFGCEHVDIVLKTESGLWMRVCGYNMYQRLNLVFGCACGYNTY